MTNGHGEQRQQVRWFECVETIWKHEIRVYLRRTNVDSGPQRTSFIPSQSQEGLLMCMRGRARPQSTWRRRILLDPDDLQILRWNQIEVIQERPYIHETNIQNCCSFIEDAWGLTINLMAGNSFSSPIQLRRRELRIQYSPAITLPHPNKLASKNRIC